MNFNGLNWYEFNLGLSKYNIKKLINADYVGEDSSAVFNFLMSYVKGDILNVFLSTNDAVAPNCVTLTYTKQDS